MLDAHPELAIPPETHFCRLFLSSAANTPLSERSRADIFRQITLSPRWADFRLHAHEFHERLLEVPVGAPPGQALAAFWSLYASKQGKFRWGDKTPGHLLCAGSIASVLPQARFVHIVRDPRDVVASMRQTWFAAGKGIADIASEWVSGIELFSQEVLRRGLPVLTVRYEDLALDSYGILERICAFIEIEYSGAMLTYPHTAHSRLSELADLQWGDRTIPSSMRIAMHSMAGQPPNTRRIGRWRLEMTDDEVSIVEAIAGDTMTGFGYNR